MARMEAMGRIKAATAILGKMAKGSLPHDAEKAEEARLELIRTAGNIPMRFEVRASDPKSEALPVIWENWEDFTARAGEMARAAKALDATTEATIRAGMGKLAASCAGCHKVYRVEK
jgi:cytochrome c556